MASSSSMYWKLRGAAKRENNAVTLQSMFEYASRETMAEGTSQTPKMKGENVDFEILRVRPRGELHRVAARSAHSWQEATQEGLFRRARNSA